MTKRPRPTTAEFHTLAMMVRISAAVGLIGRKSDDGFGIEIGGLAGRQIMRQHDHRLGQMLQQFALTKQMRNRHFSRSKRSRARGEHAPVHALHQLGIARIVR